MSSSVAAVIIAKQNQYLKRFQEAGAVSPESAVDLTQVGCRDSRLFRKLVSRGIFKPASQGKYYIDIDAANEFRENRLQRALIALLIILMIAGIVIYVSIK